MLWELVEIKTTTFIVREFNDKNQTKLLLKFEANIFSGSRMYCKEIKPYLDDKENAPNKITLVEKEKVVHKDKKNGKK